MTIKILMTWDILPGREQEYFEFVVREFIPGMQQLGLQPSQAWFTMYGDQPQILTEALMPNLKDIKKALDSSEWDELRHQLLDFVDNFSFKIISARNGFQL